MKTYPLLSGEGLEVRSGQFLKAAAVPTEKAVEMMKLTKKTNRSHNVCCRRWKVGRLESWLSDNCYVMLSAAKHLCHSEEDSSPQGSSHRPDVLRESDMIGETHAIQSDTTL